MDAGTILRIILIGIVIIVALNLILWFLGMLKGLLSLALTVAILVAVVYFIYTIFARKASY